MSVKFYTNESGFWQWDRGQRLIVDDTVCCQVHFYNGTTRESLVAEVYELEGQRLVDVPDILLQTNRPITVYTYKVDATGAQTRDGQVFTVHPRRRPADYVYTEDEIRTWEGLNERIKALEEHSGEGTVKSVNGKSPDEAGNVQIEIPKSTVKTTLTPIVEGKTYQLMGDGPVYSNLVAKADYLSVSNYENVIVEFNGVSYDCPVIAKSNGWYIGNSFSDGDVANLVYPFYITRSTSDSFVPITTVNLVATTATPKVSIYGKEEKLDPVYLPKASPVADAAGDTVTGAEFNALLTALREAGYLKI